MDFSRLALVRQSKNLSQRQVAKILGVSKSTYARWETMEEIISLNHLNDFCNYFKVTMDYMLNLADLNEFYNTNSKRKLNKIMIGKNIHSIRKKHNLTQKDLALILNTSQSTISAYESGKTLVLTVFIYNLSIKFNLSVDKMCGRLKDKKYIKI